MTPKPVSRRDGPRHSAAKITGVETFHTWGGYRDWSFVRVDTDQGVHGWGEATLEGQEDVVEVAIRQMGLQLIGHDPLASELAWQRLFRHRFWRGGAVLQSAISALDQALWDIRGKLLGAPVYRLLGGPTRERVRLYVHVGIYHPDGILEDASKAVDAGYTAVKTGSWQQAVRTREPAYLDAVRERLGALRDLVGPDIDILYDNHGRSRPDQAIRLLQAAAPYKLHFFEEPIPPEGQALTAPVTAEARRLGISLATGERLYNRWEFLPLLAGQLIDIAQPDLCHVGGITEAWKVAVLADTYRVGIAPHNPQGPISTAAAAHLAMAIPNFDILEYGPDQEEAKTGHDARGRREEVVIEPWPVVDGHLEVPDRPGLGVELDEASLRRHKPHRPMGPGYVGPLEADGAISDI